MLSSTQKNIAIIGILILIGCTSVFVLLGQGKKEKPSTVQPPSTAQKDSSSSTSTYTDVALHFSLGVPSRVKEIKKMGQGIVFGESSDGPWIIGVVAEPTLYGTTKDWLDAQPKGSASSVGYAFTRWIGPEADGKALVLQYVGPGNSGAYEKKFVMLNVKNKSLYTVDVDTWHAADATMALAPDIERALETFQATGLVTTNATGSYRTIQNWDCGITFHIPPDWSDTGILGESKILSPEDVRVNQGWANAHQDILQKEEGDAPLGPDARSLYISCQDGGDSGSRTLKTMKINGLSAHEMASTNSMPDGTSITNYQIVIEGPKTVTIQLGRTEYDSLSDAIKKIIGSISFEK